MLLNHTFDWDQRLVNNGVCASTFIKIIFTALNFNKTKS
jgi:hypothetical protein